MVGFERKMFYELYSITNVYHYFAMLKKKSIAKMTNTEFGKLLKWKSLLFLLKWNILIFTHSIV